MYNPNDERLRYVELIAKESIEPKKYYDDLLEVEVLSYYFIMETFVERLNNKKVSSLASKRAKFESLDYLIATIEGGEMDVEQFWYAVLFVYDYVEQTCTGKKSKSLPSAYSSMVDLHNYLVENPKSTITVEGLKATTKTKLKIDGNKILSHHLGNAIRQYIDGIKENPSEDFNSAIIALLNVADLEILSVQKCMVVKMFQALFKALQLPNTSEGKASGVSFNKMLLISRLCYFYGMTDNESYLIDDDAIKKAYKAYRDKKVYVPLSSAYLIG